MQDENSIVSEVEKLSSLHQKHNLAFTSCIVFCGEILKKETHKFYAVVGNTIYRLPDIIQALKLCFNATKILGKTYLPACAYVWQFLEIKLFDLDIPQNKLQACSNLFANIEKTKTALRKKGKRK